METLELKNGRTKIRNSVLREKTEERLSEIEDRSIEITQSGQEKENRFKTKQKNRLGGL